MSILKENGSSFIQMDRKNSTITAHTIYTRKNMGQKCEGNCGLWVPNPSKPTRRQRPKAVGGASERSERGRSALFKNPLFFWGMLYWGSTKFYWGVTIFARDWAQKTSLTKLFLKSSVLNQSLPNSQHKLLQTSQNKAYTEAAQNFIEAWQFLPYIGHKKFASPNWF